MNIVKASGRHDIIGRGIVFVADQREHEFKLADLSGNTVIVEHANNSYICKVNGIEGFRNNFGELKPIVGLVMKGRVTQR